MKRFGVLIVLAVLLTVPTAVAAQYADDDDYPGSGGGDINVGGGGGMDITVGGGGMDITVGGGDSGNGDDGGMGGGDVTIVDFAYQPSAIFVDAGDTVEWYNAGAVPHTVDSNTGAFSSGIINSGEGYSQTFDDQGVYGYHCNFHPQMRGLVVVN